ncbi:transglutaminase family protein [Actinospongicola halichondriae]|uniref:transglutaminase family protein n=1 Tax=Actinospongicola halichondriae TaxID=3236844 RepID=UPI003D3F0E1A
MRFDIHYRLAFEYENIVRHSQNELRACPLTDEHQMLLSYRVAASPTTRVHSFTDYWGTRVDAYGIREPHVSFEIVAESAVETRQRPLMVASPEMAALADRQFADQHAEYLSPTRHTQLGPGTDQVTQELRQRSDTDVVSLVLDVHRRVHRSLTYRSGSTEIGVTPDQVLEGGEGVCQDYAHLAVALCRSLGVPARYVSGYFFAADDATGAMALGDTAQVQTHAWFEAAIPGAGWLALDPTNALAVGERHITIGRGRDYDDVPPIRGVYAGDASAAFQTGVEMRLLSAQSTPPTQDLSMQQVQQQQ